MSYNLDRLWEIVATAEGDSKSWLATIAVSVVAVAIEIRGLRRVLTPPILVPLDKADLLKKARLYMDHRNICKVRDNPLSACDCGYTDTLVVLDGYVT